MRAYVKEGLPWQVDPFIDELRTIEGVIIHKVNEIHDILPGLGRQVVFTQVIFFAVDDEVANYLALKYPNDTFRTANSNED